MACSASSMPNPVELHPTHQNWHDRRLEPKIGHFFQLCWFKLCRGASGPASAGVKSERPGPLLSLAFLPHASISPTSKELHRRMQPFAMTAGHARHSQPPGLERQGPGLAKQERQENVDACSRGWLTYARDPPFKLPCIPTEEDPVRVRRDKTLQQGAWTADVFCQLTWLGCAHTRKSIASSFNTTLHAVEYNLQYEVSTGLDSLMFPTTKRIFCGKTIENGLDFAWAC